MLDRLYELRRARIEIVELRDYIDRDAGIDERERAAASRALELEREAARLAGAERDLMRERADMYEQLYKAVAAKPSFGCKIARVVTFGIYKCG